MFHADTAYTHTDNAQLQYTVHSTYNGYNMPRKQMPRNQTHSQTVAETVSYNTWLTINAETQHSATTDQQQAATRSKILLYFRPPTKIARSHALTSLRTKPQR